MLKLALYAQDSVPATSVIPRRVGPTLTLAPALPAVATAPVLKPHVLLVDDDPVFGKIMAQYARKFGYTLTYVASVENLPDLNHTAFDVAILDYDLGAVTGVELASYFESCCTPLPIVMVSQSKHDERGDWPGAVHEFVHKSLGPYAILDAAVDAQKIFAIHARAKNTWPRCH